MKDYSAIKNHCEVISALGREVIDEYLLYYAAAKEKLTAKMNARIRKIKHIARELPDGYLNYLKSEFIAHRIFKEGGHVSKYLGSRDIKDNLSPPQYQYLELQAQHPWRYSFAVIRDQPARDFFEMEDVLTQERYLLYSPGMQQTNTDLKSHLWLNLIGYNGQCWQTFGLILPLGQLSVDDLFFFATEINPRIEDEVMLMEEVDKDPFPFFMLMVGASKPRVVSRGHDMVICSATDPLEEFAPEDFKGEFKVEWNKDVYRLELKNMIGPPHMAEAYYDERKKELQRSAMTEAGFKAMTAALERAGYSLEEEPEIFVSTTMYNTAEWILKKKIIWNPYENNFPISDDEEANAELKKLNQFLELAFTAYNSKEKVDVKKFAKLAGVEEDTARSFWEETISKVKQMGEEPYDG